MDFYSLVHQPWHWFFSGVMIVVVMFLLLFAGRKFGVSSSYDALCTLLGAGKRINYFKEDWRSKTWLLIFLIGTIAGALIAGQWMQSPQPVQISEATKQDLEELGIHTPRTLEEGTGFVPQEIFSSRSFMTKRGLIMLIVGGFLIGFGTRWAGGCTSGHVISGLANLQLPSLIAMIGFFIGGLIMTHLFLPYILTI